jgi:hypothetical protein
MVAILGCSGVDSLIVWTSLHLLECVQLGTLTGGCDKVVM